MRPVGKVKDGERFLKTTKILGRTDTAFVLPWEEERIIVQETNKSHWNLGDSAKLFTLN